MRIPPFGLMSAAAVGQLVLARASHSTFVSKIMGGAIAIGSVFLLASSVSAFRRHRTTVNPLNVEGTTSLVRTGVFRATRNPMYVGMAGLLVAHAVYRRSLAVGVPAALFAWVIDRSQIPAEERALREQFGSEFDAYTVDVPRWLDSQSVEFRFDV